MDRSVKYTPSVFLFMLLTTSAFPSSSRRCLSISSSKRAPACRISIQRRPSCSVICSCTMSSTAISRPASGPTPHASVNSFRKQPLARIASQKAGNCSRRENGAPVPVRAAPHQHLHSSVSNSRVSARSKARSAALPSRFENRSWKSRARARFQSSQSALIRSLSFLLTLSISMCSPVPCQRRPPLPQICQIKPLCQRRFS